MRNGRHYKALLPLSNCLPNTTIKKTSKLAQLRIDNYLKRPGTCILCRLNKNKFYISELWKKKKLNLNFLRYVIITEL